MAFTVSGHKYTDTGQVPRGPALAYGCTECGGVLPSQPDDSLSCGCGKLHIDVDYHRLFVRDFASFRLLESQSGTAQYIREIHPRIRRRLLEVMPSESVEWAWGSVPALGERCLAEVADGEDGESDALKFLLKIEHR